MTLVVRMHSIISKILGRSAQRHLGGRFVRTSRLRKGTLAVSSALLFLGAAGSAQAACTWLDRTPSTRQTSITQTIEVDPNAPVGTVIHTINLPDQSDGSRIIFECSGISTYQWTGVGTVQNSGGIYATGVAGVGVIFSNYPVSATITTPAGWYGVYSGNSARIMQFVKTGTIAASTIPGSNLGRFQGAIDGNTVQVEAFTGNLTINPNRTCDFGSGTVNFNLGDVNATDLAESSASSWVQAGLPSGGCVGVNNIYMSFGGQALAGNEMLFQPTSTNPARGVGIEIQATDGEVAVPNGREMRWNPRAAGASYNFRARMVRTGEMTAGSVGTRITVSMRYN